jgi:hypothetical protein
MVLGGRHAAGGSPSTQRPARPTRFKRGKQFRSFTGLVPKASETGDTDRKGQPMSKAGSLLLRTTMVRAADNARKQDPQLARIYYLQMVERGKDHLGALCVVAANLAERAWTVMHRAEPYQLRDTDGRPGTAAEARPSSTPTGPCPPRCGHGDGPRRRGRPPRTSLQDNRDLERVNGATFPSPHPPPPPADRQPPEHQFDPERSLQPISHRESAEGVEEALPVVVEPLLAAVVAALAAHVVPHVDEGLLAGLDSPSNEPPANFDGLSQYV